MRQINLRLPEDLRKKAEKFIKTHGYKNIQELANESIRMNVSKDEVKGENFWEELPEETKRGIERIAKLSQENWEEWYRKMKKKEKKRAKFLIHRS